MSYTWILKVHWHIETSDMNRIALKYKTYTSHLAVPYLTYISMTPLNIKIIFLIKNDLYYITTNTKHNYHVSLA